MIFLNLFSLIHNQPVEPKQLTETWEERFTKISKDVLNNPVLSPEPNSLKFPKPSVGFVIWLTFLPLIGRINHFLMKLSLELEFNFQVWETSFFWSKNALHIWSKNTLQIKKFSPVRRGREDFLAIRITNVKGRGIPIFVSGSVVKVLIWQAADRDFSPLFPRRGKPKITYDLEFPDCRMSSSELWCIWILLLMELHFVRSTALSDFGGIMTS